MIVGSSGATFRVHGPLGKFEPAETRVASDHPDQ
jgi:hypothetical protein